MIDTLAEAKRAVFNARAELVLSRKFYGVLVAQVNPVPSYKVQTMATDSVHHFYNPDFIMSLTPAQRLGAQAHESEHDARHHSTRRKGRDPELWNKACDYSINPDLIAEGFELPQGVLIRADLAGMAAEEIYRILELEKMQQQQQQQNEETDESDTDDANDQIESGNSDDQAGEDGSDEQDSEPSQSSDDESSDESAEESGDDAGEETGPDAEDKNMGGATGDDDSGEGSSESEAGNESDGSQQTEGDGEDSSPDASINPSGDPGGCGEVLDAPGDEAEQADLDAKWEVAARQAVSVAKRQGNLPGHWASIIEKRHTPTQDWKNVLREYIDAGASRIQTWNRPNRRFVHTGTILPGSQRDGVNKVVFIIDASGSMGDEHHKVANELQAALDDGSINEAVFVYCDTRVYLTERFYDGDQIELGPITHGGTDMRPAFQWVEDNDSDASLIVCLTDLYIGDPGPEPQSPVLWCAYGDPRTIKSIGESLPWGKTIDVGA